MLRIRSISTRLVVGIAMAVAISGVSYGADAPLSQRVEHGGIAVEFGFEAHEQPGAASDSQTWSLPGLTHVSFKDAVSGRPYEGIRPAAWMVARRSQQVADELSCEAKAQQLTAGSLGARADIDLNTYRLVTLNHDNTLTFINPHVSLRNSKLEAIVQLPGLGYDWVLLPDQGRLLVSLRDANAVAVIDTVTRKLLGTIDFPQGSRPTRLLADADGRRVWVGLDGRAEVALVDALKLAEVARIRVGRGLHTLAAAPDTPWVFVTNADDSSVSIVDRTRLQHVTDVPVGKTPVAAAWSAAAQRLAVLAINGGTLDLIDAAAGKVTGTITLERGVVQLGLFDGGRYAFVLNHVQNRASLIDVASLSVKASVEVAGKPDQIAFSREFAYVRGQSTANVSVINLKEARAGRIQSVTVPMGQRAPQDASESIGVASMLAPPPEGNGVIVANAPDQVIYRYAEGLMAPVGNFSNYRRRARALLVLDSSLSERAPGRFVAPTNFQFGARYDVIVKSLRPEVTACFVVAVDGPARGDALATAPDALHASLDAVEPLSGAQTSIRLRLADAKHQPITGVSDGVLLVMQRAGQWQRRVPVRDVGAGLYEARVQLPERGEFELLLSAPSHDLGYVRGRLGSISLPLNAGAVAKTVAAGRENAQR